MRASVGASDQGPRTQDVSGMQNGELGRAEDGKTGTMSAAGIFRGTVERIAANGAFVRVRQLNVDHVFGPCATVEFPVATPLAVGRLEREQPCPGTLRGDTRAFGREYLRRRPG